MPMESDLTIDTSLFETNRIDPSTIALNNRIGELGKTDVKWWQVCMVAVIHVLLMPMCT